MALRCSLRLFQKTAISSTECMKLEDKFSAHNYHPIPVVFHSAKGCKVVDPEGREYYDFLSAYSAVNQGHNHPRIVAAMKAQLDLLALSSRAFHNDRFGPFCKFMNEYFGYEKILPMNTGAESVETAVKLSRKWGYLKKGIAPDQAIIIACNENFHGRTTTMVSMSDDPEGHDYYGPYTPGLARIPFNDIPALEEFLKHHGKNVAAFLVEPIQGEAGVKVPALGYLKKAKEVCDAHNVLLIADEVQTGIGRTGKLLCHYYDEVRPDIVCLAKALSGGLYPVSCVLADSRIMDVLKPGTHGSTFGGNPIACAVATEALTVIKEEKLTERAYELGLVFREELQGWAKGQQYITEVRGRGLLNAIELNDVTPDKDMAYRLCIKMRDNGLLAKPTHGNIIRFSPPLVISKDQLRECVEIIKKSYLALLPNLMTSSGGHH